MRLALAALFLSASVAFAAEPAPDRSFIHPNGAVLRLHDAPCVSRDGALAGMPESVRPQFKAATLVVDGAPIPACWAPHEGVTFIVDAFGGGGALEHSAFKRMSTL